MSRTFTLFAEQDPEAKALVEALPRLKGRVASYREHMRQLGAHLADCVLAQLAPMPTTDICVICTVEDADFLARGLIEALEAHSLGASIRMICLWNQRIQSDGISIAPVVRAYEEAYDQHDAIFIIVKSIIAGACVVKTNLTRAITVSDPKRIFVASPVMLEGAERRLASEFPEAVSRKFEFIHFATDTDKSDDGEEVIPGIGGSVYELLGLGDGTSKNRYIPDIVRERRRKAFPDIHAA
ncbi:hypothetical protein VITFI_CDS0032 [Vitreoscilla filiformis]|uniref:Uncharacterized protein n=1 Tax=Vitreoscilla filiformis TaxID=63 RepID=A0A221K9X0_VITFI|nr:hypothetical protein [Vitreoscilla filiformis]ASM75811.1 hypothetical protein VITFI_CDS0032 [Vitreoscilla filiformis]